MNNRLYLVVSVMLLMFQAGQAFADAGIVRMKDRQDVTFDKMVTDLGQVDAIFVGEAHNYVSHHQLELDIIRALHERKVNLAIGLEMFMSEGQQLLDDWTGGKMSEQEFQAGYSRNWTFDWQLYRDIFIFARDNHIPMIALNIPKQLATKVARQGFASLTTEEKKLLPPGITCDVKSAYTDVLKMAFGQIYQQLVKQGNFTSFCESQTLRNSAMALNIARYRQQHPDRKVVAIAGIWHAVKGGAPASLSESGKHSIRVVLPEIPELGPHNATPGEMDYLVRKQSKAE